MSRGIVTRLIGKVARVAERLTDSRKVSNATKYSLMDALKSALAVFYFQHTSLLSFQKALKRRYQKSNLERLFGVWEIPSSVQVKNILDGIDPGELECIFDDGLQECKRQGVLYSQYRVLDMEIPVAVDGTWYFSSNEVHCEHCLTKKQKLKRGGERTLYHHDVLAFVIVKYDNKVVIPLVPEFISNEDGQEKQDCERNAFKRNIKRRSEQFRGLKPIFLGDDLYACYPICHDLDDRGFSFIFVCKDESHSWIAEQVSGEGVPFEIYERKEWDGRNHLIHRYSWLNNIEDRADPIFMYVNYLKYQIWNVEKNEWEYQNSWITNKTITIDNVVEMAKVGRARWKIENEHHNTLKHQGYNLEHNFGHGKNHAACIFCLLNLFIFLIHGLQELADEKYKNARFTFSSRKEFFGAMRHEISFHFYEDWLALLTLLADADP
jgi:hypothetical protein